MTSPTTARPRRRRARKMVDAWTPEFLALVDRRDCTHGATGPRYCGLCKVLARNLAQMTGVREFR